MRVNQYKNNNEMLSKSRINSEFKKEYPMFKDIPLSEIKQEFTTMNGIDVKTGMPNNKNRQRTTKYIKKSEFAKKLFRRYFRITRR